MRISLDGDSTEFAKQVAGLRKQLGGLDATGQGQEKVSARMMIPTFLPYLHVLRGELRDNVIPSHVMTGAADLLANIAVTTVQSIMEATPLIEAQTVEQLLTEAIHKGCQTIRDQAEAAKKAKRPDLKVVTHANGGAPKDEVN